MNRFINATVFTGSGWLTNATVLTDNGRIQEITTAKPAGNEADTVVDLNGDYLVPGLIDLQLYGGNDQFLNDTPTPETVRHIYDTHLRNGTTTLLPTINSTSLDVMLRATAAVQMVRTENPFGVPGIHIEGPYFNPIKRGAHSAAYVRTPAEGELETLFSQNADAIRILTLAPEILTQEQLALLNRLKHPNTRLSLGHSNATYQQATDALNTGFIPLGTHLYNAMRGYESREPGVVGALFDHPTVRVSLVADGYHCYPPTIRIAHRILGDRLFLISDALFTRYPGGPPPRAKFSLGEFVVHYEPDTDGPGESARGRYVNDADNLAGSALSIIDCVRVCVEKAGLPLVDVLRKATEIPADVIGMGDKLGRIAPGYVANLVRLDQALTVKNVWVSGEIAV